MLAVGGVALRRRFRKRVMTVTKKATTTAEQESAVDALDGAQQLPLGPRWPRRHSRSSVADGREIDRLAQVRDGQAVEQGRGQISITCRVSRPRTITTVDRRALPGDGVRLARPGGRGIRAPQEQQAGPVQDHGEQDGLVEGAVEGLDRAECQVARGWAKEPWYWPMPRWPPSRPDQAGRPLPARSSRGGRARISVEQGAGASGRAVAPQHSAGPGLISWWP